MRARGLVLETFAFAGRRAIVPPEKKGASMAGKKKRDLEKKYSVAQTAAKLRRLADCLETGKPFRIQIAGERIFIPAHAVFTVAHERERGEEEVEFQFAWKHA
jgi:amphi-Trp domain-containing protein